MRSTRTIPGSLSTDTIIHPVGDPHVPVLPTLRQTKLQRDLTNGLLPTPAVRIILGDLSNENGSNVNAGADDTTSVAWMNGITPAVPTYTLIGNHDIWQNNRSAATAAAAYGQASLDQVIDLPNVRLILVNPDTMALYPSDQNSIVLESAKLTWLAAQLAGTSKDCIIFCHAPLENTVVDASAAGSGGTIFDSNTVGFFVMGPNHTDDTEVRTVLGAHSNAIAWVSGHTHEDPFRTTTTMWTTTTCGSRTVAAINVPVIYYVTPGVDTSDEVYGVFLVHKGSKTVEVHMRRHSSGVWDGNDEGRVVSLTAS